MLRARQLLLAVVLLPAAGVAAAAPVAPLDRQTVESYVDTQIPAALARSGVPGAVVVVVRRDETLLAKGYGVSDIDRHTAVDATRTLFDLASIGKTLTAIVTLQLIDEGRLDLDADVNRYLKSTRTRGPPVTLRMLLGHRGGFDADLTGLFVPLGGDIRVPATELARRLHPIVQPGRVTAYDNQGYGVIGLVIRDVSGQPLPELFAHRVFEPLAMTGAVWGQPRDGGVRLARCYVVHGPSAVDSCPYWLYREAIQGAGGSPHRARTWRASCGCSSIAVCSMGTASSRSGPSRTSSTLTTTASIPACQAWAAPLRSSKSFAVSSTPTAAVCPASARS